MVITPFELLADYIMAVLEINLYYFAGFFGYKNEEFYSR